MTMTMTMTKIKIKIMIMIMILFRRLLPSSYNNLFRFPGFFIFTCFINSHFGYAPKASAYDWNKRRQTESGCYAEGKGGGGGGNERVGASITIRVGIGLALRARLLVGRIPIRFTNREYDRGIYADAGRQRGRGE